jgi:hypothetical protein
MLIVRGHEVLSLLKGQKKVLIDIAQRVYQQERRRPCSSRSICQSGTLSTFSRGLALQGFFDAFNITMTSLGGRALVRPMLQNAQRP